MKQCACVNERKDRKRLQRTNELKPEQSTRRPRLLPGSRPFLLQRSEHLPLRRSGIEDSRPSDETYEGEEGDEVEHS